MNRPTLYEFLCLLNQDEDMVVTIVNYDTDEEIFKRTWKSSLQWYDYKEKFEQYRGWFLIDFCLALGGLEIRISKDNLQ